MLVNTLSFLAFLVFSGLALAQPAIVETRNGGQHRPLIYIAVYRGTPVPPAVSYGYPGFAPYSFPGPQGYGVPQFNGGAPFTVPGGGCNGNGGQVPAVSSFGYPPQYAPQGWPAGRGY